MWTTKGMYLARSLQGSTKMTEGEDKLAAKLSITKEEEAAKSCQVASQSTVNEDMGEQGRICKPSLNSQWFKN